MRHNAVRDVVAVFVRTVCEEASTEPALIQLIGNEGLARGSYLEDNARLDVAFRGFWLPLQKMFLDVSFTHPNAPSIRARKLGPLLKSFENYKKEMYDNGVVQVEHASFTPIVFVTNGAMSEKAERFHSVLADKMSEATDCSYANTMKYHLQN